MLLHFLLCYNTVKSFRCRCHLPPPLTIVVFWETKMREYVDDTEDYINIMLDDKQNQLLQMGVLLSTANLLINAGIVVVGLFGMNITIDIFGDSTPKVKFWETTFGTVAGVVLMYIIAIYCGKKGGLLG